MQQIWSVDQNDFFPPALPADPHTAVWFLSAEHGPSQYEVPHISPLRPAVPQQDNPQLRHWHQNTTTTGSQQKQSQGHSKMFIVLKSCLLIIREETYDKYFEESSPEKH